MANLYITEYADVVKAAGNMPIQAPKEPAVAEQKISYTTAASSAAFNDATIFVRLYADADVHIHFGKSPTATAAKQLVPAFTEIFRGVVPGQKVSAYDGTS